ncbi:hypothetical protein EDD18DRAFT_811842 [Armillaria luteobubalina]|uniref:Uncharacterized protein n=1 Tax=Armillaria luteobubalina TaxID=153913 RepID=A0AA39URB6_9AGAR|nr:hypothetical protein EDD18DRAFT_811842 [Armillaria luteobubalina]
MAATSLACPVPPSRRHSLTPPSRRPLRSSPLAGPSFNLSPDGRLELSPLDAAKAKPNRISSTPDLPSLTVADVQLSKRLSTPPVITFRSSLPSPPPSPHNASHRSKSRDSFVSVPTHTQVPHFPRAYTSKSTPSSPSSSYTSLPDQSWLTANPYLTTPKFSRLSLASPNVVMPVSAKERRRSMASASVDGHTKVSSATFGKILFSEIFIQLTRLQIQRGRPRCLDENLLCLCSQSHRMCPWPHPHRYRRLLHALFVHPEAYAHCEAFAVEGLLPRPPPNVTLLQRSKTNLVLSRRRT